MRIARGSSAHFDPRVLGHGAGVNFSSVLIDGFVGATWTLKREPKAATMRVALIDALPKRERVAVQAEGDRLLAFIAADVGSRNVIISEAGAKPRTNS
jgi:hypothetical protein